MDIAIRKAMPPDAEALALFMKNLGMFPWMNEENPHLSQERVAAQLALCLADTSHTVLVAHRNDKLIGYAAVHWNPYLVLPAPEGYISELFIDANTRGAGVGSKLLDEIRREAVRRGCSRLSLLNGENRDSYQRRFYQERGFKERTTMVNFVLTL